MPPRPVPSLVRLLVIDGIALAYLVSLTFIVGLATYVLPWVTTTGRAAEAEPTNPWISALVGLLAGSAAALVRVLRVRRALGGRRVDGVIDGVSSIGGRMVAQDHVDVRYRYRWAGRSYVGHVSVPDDLDLREGDVVDVLVDPRRASAGVLACLYASQTRADRSETERRVTPVQFDEAFRRSDWIGWLAGVTGAGLVLWPAQLLGDGQPTSVAPAGAYLLAAFGGALATSLWYPDRRYWASGLIPGMIAGLGAVAAVRWIGDSGIWFALGMAPGVFAHYVFLRERVSGHSSPTSRA